MRPSTRDERIHGQELPRERRGEEDEAGGQSRSTGDEEGIRAGDAEIPEYAPEDNEEEDDPAREEGESARAGKRDTE